jgi:DNA-directed RNA polymerase subunit RPC12/RpoP
MKAERKHYTESITPGCAPPSEGDPSGQKGIVCPHCACRHFLVVYTRPGRGGRIVRRRECRHCGWRVTTEEKARDDG